MKELLQQARDALETCRIMSVIDDELSAEVTPKNITSAITALNEALAQPVQPAPDLEAMRTDADRYRWLRNALVATDAEFFIAVDSVHHEGRWALPADEVDAAIDAAIARHNNLPPSAQPVQPKEPS